MREHAEWNVDTHIRRATGPTSVPTRSFISPAALLVKVIASSSNGEIPRSAMRYATRWVRSRVLPEPAPATTRTGPSGALTASRWTGFSPSRSSAASLTYSAPAPSARAARATLRTEACTQSSWCVTHGCSVQVFGSAAGAVAIETQLLRRRLAGRRPERAQQLGAVLVERDRERTRRLVEVEGEVRLPVRVQ